MKRFSDRHQLSTLSEINITPLMDLAMVLLIIFMITTPLMENSTNLILPSARGMAGAVEPGETETINIDKDAVISIGQTVVPPEQIHTALAARPGLAVVIRAHKELPVQKLVDVMEEVKKAGVTKVGIVGTSMGEE